MVAWAAPGDLDVDPAGRLSQRSDVAMGLRLSHSYAGVLRSYYNIT